MSEFLTPDILLKDKAEQSSEVETISFTNEHEVENICPIDNLSVEFYENPYDDAEDQGSIPTTTFMEDSVNSSFIVPETSYMNQAEEDFDEKNVSNGTIHESSYISDMYSDKDETDYKELQMSNIEDFYRSDGLPTYDESSNSNVEENREEHKGSQLMRFRRIVRALEQCDYGIIQVLYQLLFQQSAWDTQELLTQRILEFSGLNCSQNSEEYFNREMLLRTQTDEILLKIGQIFGLDQVNRMVVDLNSGRVSLIAGIMQFILRPHHRNRVLNAEIFASPNDGKKGSASVTNCGCRSRCIQKFLVGERKNLIEYSKELENKCTLEQYLLNLVEMRQISKKNSLPDDNKRMRDVAYTYTVKFNERSVSVCKGGFMALHGVKITKMNMLQKKMKNKELPKMTLKDFPPIPEPPKKPERKRKTYDVASKNSLGSSLIIQTSVGCSEIDEDSKSNSVESENGKGQDEANMKMDKVSTQEDSDKDSSVDYKKKKLKEFPLVVNNIENAAEELLLDVHFLLFLSSAENEKVKDNILDFDGFNFGTDTEEYDERIEFLQRMTFKIVSDVAISFSLEVLSNKEDTIKNILKFLSRPDEKFIKEKTTLPLSLSDVELDDIGDLSDSDVSITCEVVEKKVECIDLLSSGEDSDREDKPRKVKTPPKNSKTSQVKATTPNIVAANPNVSANPPVEKPSNNLTTSKSESSQVIRTLKDFETIRKIVNTHPHEYLVDIYDLLYLSKHEPSTLRDDILKFSGFTFERGTQDYVKRKQLLDRMLYNSVRRIYNTLIHTSTEVRVFSKPTMITEIFQFLFKLPDHDTSVRPPPTAKPVTKPQYLHIAPKANPIPTTTPSGGITLPNQVGKLSDLKRVFQRVACFPCEYLIDVHKLLFMADCDQKVIRQNIFAFKGFSFGPESQEFQQRKMYLEYLTFHSLRKISSVLTTRSVDLRNSTKHELATHLTLVLTEYCNLNNELTPAMTEVSVSSTSSSSAPNNDPVENIVVTPLIDPSITGQYHGNTESSVSTTENNAPISQPASQPFNIAIVDARSVNSQSGIKRKGPNSPEQPPASKSQKTGVEFADINLPEVEQYQQLYGNNDISKSKEEEMIVPVECVIEENEEFCLNKPKTVRKEKAPTVITSEQSLLQSKIREVAGDDQDEDLDKPLSSLVGHPIDSVLKENIVNIVEKTNLQSISINGVIQKVYSMYPKFDLSYRKEFIKSTLRSILYKLGQEKGSDLDKRNADSPDCSVSTTENCEGDSTESVQCS